MALPRILTITPATKETWAVYANVGPDRREHAYALKIVKVWALVEHPQQELEAENASTDSPRMFMEATTGVVGMITDGPSDELQLAPTANFLGYTSEADKVAAFAEQLNAFWLDHADDEDLASVEPIEGEN